MGTRQEAVRRLFGEALDLTPAERAPFLERACGGDGALRREIERLLDAAARAGEFLGAPTGPESTATVAGPIREGPGASIGPYRLLHLVGEGGFGAVYMAEQRDPVERRVALKIIKPGMDTRQVIARFEAERQALAMMDHEGIAKVFDAGATETGRPYFVMELVSGEPITVYCDRHNLTIRERLDLFVQACRAVQHAHTKGVIHRDLKPSNILVSTRDGRPLAKVIDFGIAKATAKRLTEKTLFTELRQLIGTPEYMSPEQAEASLDIDTRADVYALGVLLYELLTGVTPLDPATLRSAAWGEMQRIIREEEPQKPSTRLSTLDALPSVAAHRRTEPARLSRVVRGDLDWIAMMCLEKDRARRYETANALAMDVMRHLAGEAVTAAPPSRVYRLKKQIRRNKGPVAAGALVVLALAAGLAAPLLQASEARWQAARADERAQAAKEAEAAAATAALAEKERADELKKVSDFQAGMLAQVDATEAGRLLTLDIIARFEAALAAAPEDERGAQVEAFTRQLRNVNATDAARELIDRTILKPAVTAIDEQFKNQPIVDAQLRHVLAACYTDLGLYDAAMPLQLRALETRGRVLGEDHPDTLTSTNYMGFLLQAHGNLPEAEPYLREALEKRRRVLGEEHPDTLTSINNMGALLEAQGRRVEAEPYFREALEKSRRVQGEDHPDTLTSINNMGFLLQAQGRLPEAEPYLREALEKSRRVRGEEHQDTLVSIYNMGFLLLAQGKPSEAEPYLRDALEKRQRLRGEDHPDTLASIGSMSTLLRAQGRLSEAELYAREAMEKMPRVLGAEHPNTLGSVDNMGVLLLLQGQLAESEPYLHDALEKRRRLLGEEHPDTLASILNWGHVLLAQGRLSEAEPYLREALEKHRRLLGEEHPHTLTSIINMGVLLRSQGRLDEAEPYCLDALEKTRRNLGEGHPTTLESVNNMGALLWNQGKLAAAEPYFREALEGRRVLGAENADTIASMAWLGTVLVGQNTLEKAVEAEGPLRQCLTHRAETLPAGHWRIASMRSLLGGALLVQGRALLATDRTAALAKLAEARPFLLDGYEQMNPPPGAADRKAEALQRVIDLFEALDAAEPGQGHDAEAAVWRAKRAEHEGVPPNGKP